MRPVAALALLLALAACGGESEPPSGFTDEPTAQEDTTTLDQQPAEEEPPPYAVSLVSSCDDEYPVVFQTDPFRLVAEVEATNEGSETAEVDVTTAWLFFGGGKTRLTKTVVLEPAETKRVAFSKPSNYAEISKMVGWQPGDTMCRSRGSGWIVD